MILIEIETQSQLLPTGGSSDKIISVIFSSPNAIMKFKVLLPAIALAVISLAEVRALIVPFTEDFSSGNANWLTGPASAPAATTWFSTGGVGGGAYIQTVATNSGGGFSGPIIFRGNASNDASGDAFVGDWLTGGVTLFTAYVRHDASTSLGFYVRFAANNFGAGASSTNFTVAPNVWTEISVPIASNSFQSFGSSSFITIFSSVQDVQIALSVDPPIGATYAVGLDNVAVVPEPRALVLLGFSVVLLAGHFVRRRATAKQTP